MPRTSHTCGIWRPCKENSLIIFKSLGAHGVAPLLGGMLLIFGCIKLSFGKLIYCQKTKAEAMAEELKKKGLVNQQGGSCSKLATCMQYIAQL